MKPFFLLITILMLCFSCSEAHKSSYVAKESEVLDSIYVSHSAVIEGLFDTINNLNLDTALASKFALINAYNTEDLVAKRRALLKAKAFVKPNLNLTVANTIVINNTNNWLSLRGINDELLSTLKTNYVLTKFSDGSYENSPLYISDNVPDFFQHYNNPKYFNIYRDSIDTKKKRRLENDRQAKLLQLKNITYGIIINDIYAKKPYLVTSGKFTGGVLMSTAHLYNLNTKALVGYTTITVKSSDKIKHEALADIGNYRATILNRRLQKDLLKQRNKKIIDYFNIKTNASKHRPF